MKKYGENNIFNGDENKNSIANRNTSAELTAIININP